jgi:ferritin-like metal-binding protein YciE
LETGLKDIYSAEKQLVNALPEIARAIDNEDLEEAVTFHLEQTKKHVARLEKVFDRLHITKTDSEKCPAMEGLIEEGKKVISEFERGPVRDSALIIGAQKIEHYEIAAYGSLCELADVLGENKVHDILGRTLDEEEETDINLSDIAKDVNDEACDLTESRYRE